MATVKPFAAVRPSKEYADKMISLPYDVMNRSEAARMAKGNPYSFLRICRSEIDIPDQENPYDQSVYEKARENISTFLKDGIMIQEEKPIFYIYRQIMDGRIQTGIVGCVAIDEYLDDTIKKHEFTRVEKELDRINHFDVCNANTEPVFLTYRDREDLRKAMEDWVESHAPEYDIVTEDGIGHMLWLLDDDRIINAIKGYFKDVPDLYIADGHHRSASAVKVGLKRREENPGYTGDEEFNYFMAVIFPDNDLKIYDYNRVVKDLNGLTEDELLKKLEKVFTIEPMGEVACYPERKHTFTMFLGSRWYRLAAKENVISDHPIDGLDVSILQTNVLDPILGIKDPRRDNRIDFVGGIRGLVELERRVNEDMAIAFALFPVSISDLLAVSDAGLVMPPKSTWFEPKLGSGLFIHLL